MAGPHAPARERYPPGAQRSRGRGFTLIELVVVIIILGVLAALAVPRYIALGRDARLASLQTLTGALWAETTSVHLACTLAPTCDPTAAFSVNALSGVTVFMNYGYAGAGDWVGTIEIDALVTHDGFSVVLPDIYHTTFTFDNAPDPANCAVIYQEALDLSGPAIRSVTSGC